MASIVTSETWVPLADVMGYCNAGPERTREFEHLLNEAVGAIQDELGCKVLTATYTNSLYDGSGECELYLRAWPATTLTAVEFLESSTDTTEEWTAYHGSLATAYIDEPTKRFIYFRTVTFPRGRRNVRVSMVAGYSKDGLNSIPKVPAVLQTALKETCLEWFKLSDLQVVGLSSVRGAMGETTAYRERFGLPKHVIDLVTPHRSGAF